MPTFEQARGPLPGANRLIAGIFERFSSRRWPSSRIRAVAKAGGALLIMGLSALSIRALHPSAVFGRIGALPPYALIYALIAALLQSVFLATRFWIVFAPRHRPRWVDVARAFSFGQFVNLYLPARAGDVLKVIALSRDSRDSRPGATRDATRDLTRGATPSGASVNDRAPPITAADATGALLADKGLDVVALALLALAFARGALAFELARMDGAGGAGLAVGAVGAIGGAVAAMWLLRRFWSSGYAKIASGARGTMSAVRGILSPGRFPGGLALGALSWLAELAMMAFICRGLGVHVTFGQSVCALVVLNVGIAVPVSVANIGAYEAATVVGLLPFGVSTTDAIAIGTIHHAMQIGAVIVSALGFWMGNRIIARAAQKSALIVPAELPATSSF